MSSMTKSTCSLGCRDTHPETATLARELRARKWLGFALIGASCGIAYLAYTVSAWLWIPCALLAWFGTYQTIYGNGCGGCGAPRAENTDEDDVLTDAQRARRRRMAHGFLAATLVLALTAARVLPALWPPAAIAGWFAASFYIAAWIGYVGCPEVGAIPSWVLGRRIATRCAPLDRIDDRLD
jgi:hypothetical protein